MDPSPAYSEAFSESIIDPAPAPVDEDEVGAEHGPFVPVRLTIVPVRTTTTLEFRFVCEFGIEDENGNYWDWGFQANLYDPGGNPLASNSHSVYNKPGTYGTVAVTLFDPAEGTYRCEIDWNVQGFALPRRTRSLQLRYTCQGDLERTKIRKEYSDKGLGESRWPSCSDLQNNHSSTYFSSSELNNSGWHSLFWMTSTFMSRIDGVRADYQAPVGMSSGYRCPEKNAGVGGTTNSYHQFGRAGDLVPSGESNTQAWRNEISDWAELNGLDPLDEGDHVHVEWEF